MGHDSRNSYWPTPPEVTRALLAAHPPPDGSTVLEPSAGSGAIVKELVAAGYPVHAIEINAAYEQHLVDAGADIVRIRDFLTVNQWPFATAIVGNPPWDPTSALLAHVRHAVALRPQYCALLLPVRFLGSRQRGQWLAEHPPRALFPLYPRPRFIGGGGKEECAWMIWCDREEVTDPIRALDIERWRRAYD